MKNQRKEILIFAALLLASACSRTYHCITTTSCGTFIYHDENKDLTTDSVFRNGEFITKIDCK